MISHMNARSFSPSLNVLDTVSQIKVPLFGSTSTCVTLTVKSLGSWILTEPISTLNFSKSTIWESKDKSSLVPRWSLRHLQKQKKISGKNYKKYPCTSLAEKKGGGRGRAVQNTDTKQNNIETKLQTGGGRNWKVTLKKTVLSGVFFPKGSGLRCEIWGVLTRRKMGLFCCLYREETKICLPIVLRSNFDNKQFSLKKKRNLIITLSLLMWSLRMWIAAFRLHTASLLQAMRWIEYALLICCCD